MLFNESRIKITNQLLLFFILLQPLLDLITSLSIRIFHTSLTIGLLVRFFVLFLGLLYILLLKQNPNRKHMFLFLIALGLMMAINLVNNYLVKDPFSISEEVKFLLKTCYFIIMLFTYTIVFKSILVDHLNKKVLKYIIYSMTFIGIIMLISSLTHTSYQSYEGGKVGYVGWFYAGNELGAILSMGFPIVVLAALKHSKWYLIPLFLTIFSLLSLGTKVGYVTIIIGLVIGIFFSLVNNFNIINKNSKKIPKLNILILFCFLAGVAVYTPFSPLAKNIGIQMSWLGINKDDSQANVTKHHQKKTKKEAKVTDEQVQNLVFSGREKFLNDQKNYFHAAPLSQKLFGMGYGGNYKTQPKMVEMDFHDLFFSFGVVGSILFIVPMLYFLVHILIRIFTDFKRNFNYENILIGSAIILGLGIAYMAGHVITAPGVSIYLAILVSFLWTKLEN